MAACSEGFVAVAGGIAHGRRDAQAVVALAELPQFSEGVVGCLGEGGEAVEQGGQVCADRIIGPGIAPQQSQGSSSMLHRAAASRMRLAAIRQSPVSPVRLSPNLPGSTARDRH
jgi:hypothetical protein